MKIFLALAHTASQSTSLKEKPMAGRADVRRAEATEAARRRRRPSGGWSGAAALAAVAACATGCWPAAERSHVQGRRACKLKRSRGG